MTDARPDERFDEETRALLQARLKAVLGGVPERAHRELHRQAAVAALDRAAVEQSAVLHLGELHRLQAQARPHIERVDEAPMNVTARASRLRLVTRPAVAPQMPLAALSGNPSIGSGAIMG